MGCLGGNGEVIRDKVVRTLAAAEARNGLGQPARIQVRATWVGTGRPQYVLIAPPEWVVSV